jgi:hypothetical protein
MSVYNGGKYLRDAINSILNQTFTDFEFVIIDNGSTDGTAEILRSYRDSRIIGLSNRTNIGLSASINRALRISKGEFIARMDADDVSVVDRIRKQVEYLDTHTDVSVVATWARIIRGDVGTSDVWRASSNAGVLAWELSWNCPINHSSVMMRRQDLLDLDFYDSTFRCADDHNLWLRMVKSGKRIAVIPEPLNAHRLWAEQTGAKEKNEQQQEILTSAHEFVEWLVGRTVDINQVEEIIRLYSGTGLQQDHNISSCLTLAREVQCRCAELYNGCGGREIRDRSSDVLIFAAATAVKAGRGRQARRSILTALSRSPLRAARPWTLKLLLQTFFVRTIRQVTECR